MIRGRGPALALTAAVLGLVRPCSAGVISGAPFLTMEPDAGPAGMGRAYTALAEGPAAQFWNPAGLAHLDFPALTLTHLDSLADTRYNFLRISGPLKGGKAGLALSASLSAIEDLYLYGPQGEIQQTLQAGDLVVAFSGAWAPKPSFAAGATAKWYRSELAGFTASGAAFDAGLLFLAKPPFGRLGLSISNLGPGIKYISYADPLPLLLRAGYAQKAAGNEVHSLTLAWDYAYLVPDKGSSLIFGAAYSVRHLLSLRAGYRFGPELGRVSAGAGFEASFFSLDYAFIPYALLGPTHRITATLKKMPPRPPAARTPEPPRGAGTPLPTQVSTPTPAETPAPRTAGLWADPQLVIPGAGARIALTLAPGAPGSWELRIVDASGAPQRQFRGARPPEGPLAWDGTTDAGTLVSTGLYEVRLTSPGQEDLRAPIRVKARESIMRTLPSELLFGSGEFVLNPSRSGPLEDLARDILSRYDGAAVMVTGHCDSTPPKPGSQVPDNQELSLRRAQAVAAFLVQKGLDPGRVGARGLGATAPVADNRLASGRAANRRVEVEIRLAEAVSYLPDSLAGEVSLDREGSPYVIRGLPRVPAGSTLRLGPGTRLQSPAEGSGAALLVAGRLLIEGREGQPVEWLWPKNAGTSLALGSGGSVQGQSLRMKGGGLRAEKGRVQLNDSSFEDGAQVSLGAYGSLELKRSRLAGGGVGLLMAASSAEARLENCVIEGNAQGGLVVQSGKSLEAAGCRLRNNQPQARLLAPWDLDLRECDLGDEKAVEDGAAHPGAGRVLTK